MTRPPTPSQLGDEWYESEEPTRTGLVRELRRARRRFVVRPLPVLVLATAITAVLVYRVETKVRAYPAEVVLALTEGSLSNPRTVGRADTLRTYVESVLLSDRNLTTVIEKHDLFPLRTRLGPQFAVEELRSQLEIAVWRNSFVHYHAWDAHARKSARIGITFVDTDPDRAFAIATDLAKIAIATHQRERQRLTGAIAREVKLARDAEEAQLRRLTAAIAVKQTALALAQRDGKHRLVAALHVDLTALDGRVGLGEQRLARLLQSPEGIADQIARAGLDVTLGIVEERRPERRDDSAFVIVLVAAVIATGAFVISALLLGAFDRRIHEADDVERLGLPMLGHVPAFAGDHVGSLRARLRGIARPHRPSVTRWLSLR